MTWQRITRTVVGTILILLGLLWTLQGADVVRIRPILCVSNCQPVTGGSLAWLITGLVAMVAGLAVVGLRRPRH